MASCWENLENSSKRPQGYKPQLSLNEAKKKLSKAQSKQRVTQNNRKTEVQGAMVEFQGAIVECKNEFSCITISFKKLQNCQTKKL